MSKDRELLPCPFCGGASHEIRENGRVWLGTKYGEPSSVSVFHHCKPIEGQPSRGIERIGKDKRSAIEAWNRRARLAEPQDDAARLADEIKDLLRQMAPHVRDRLTSKLLERAEVALRSAQAGRVSVPMEPTREMLNAAMDVHGHKLCDISCLGIRRSPQWMFEQSYKAMLAASQRKEG